MTERIDMSHISDSVNTFVIYLLEKTNVNTLYAIKNISDVLGIEERLIGFCGLKDRQAITKQYISIRHIPGKTSPDAIAKKTFNTCTLTYVGYSKQALYIGSLIGNSFSIVVRNISEYRIVPRKAMVNYFGEQRFSDNNAKIGEHIIRGEYLKAAQLAGVDHACVQRYLEQKPNDGVGSLKTLPPHIISLYVHAFQSLLWNQIASAIIQESTPYVLDDELQIAIPQSDCELEFKTIPLIGFGYEEDHPAHSFIDAVLKQWSITPRDFVHSSFPQVSKEGGSRPFFTPISELDVKQANDVIHFSFFLDKGAYATIALRHLLEKCVQ
ncbi:MAG TPA: tRNA pseudouridine(13) synthase TruD [Acidobacteriota bacterium]|nr:tRNA pseudouridine(13) synthase TruD [Acidobacteriota bacterium]